VSDPNWQSVRRAALRRDEHECVDCGEDLERESVTANVHHETRRVDGGSDELENLVSLCEPCHHERHKEQRRQRMSGPKGTREIDNTEDTDA